MKSLYASHVPPYAIALSLAAAISSCSQLNKLSASFTRDGCPIGTELLLVDITYKSEVSNTASKRMLAACVDSQNKTDRVQIYDPYSLDISMIILHKDEAQHALNNALGNVANKVSPSK